MDFCRQNFFSPLNSKKKSIFFLQIFDKKYRGTITESRGVSRLLTVCQNTDLNHQNVEFEDLEKAIKDTIMNLPREITNFYVKNIEI